DAGTVIVQLTEGADADMQLPTGFEIGLEDVCSSARVTNFETMVVDGQLAFELLWFATVVDAERVSGAVGYATESNVEIDVAICVEFERAVGPGPSPGRGFLEGDLLA